MVLRPASLLRRHRMGIVEADQTFAEDLTPRTDMMIVAGLPDIVRDVE